LLYSAVGARQCKLLIYTTITTGCRYMGGLSGYAIAGAILRLLSFSSFLPAVLKILFLAKLPFIRGKRQSGKGIFLGSSSHCFFLVLLHHSYHLRKIYTSEMLFAFCFFTNNIVKMTGQNYLSTDYYFCSSFSLPGNN